MLSHVSTVLPQRTAAVVALPAPRVDPRPAATSLRAAVAAEVLSDWLFQAASNEGKLRLLREHALAA